MPTTAKKTGEGLVRVCGAVGQIFGIDDDDHDHDE
jgi:hypothetical protein